MGKIRSLTDPQRRRPAGVLVHIALTVSMVGFMLGLNFLAQASPSGCDSTSTASPTPTGSGITAPGSPTGVQAPVPAPDIQTPTTAPAIQIINPLPTSPATLSDKSDGDDNKYHFVVGIANAPSGAVAEASIKPNGGAERAIGLLCPAEDGPGDTLELYWDVPDAMAEGAGVLTVRLFTDGSSTAQQIATDQMPIDIQHKDGAPATLGSSSSDVAAAETVDLSWPVNGGPLSFYKASGSDKQWQTVIEGTTSVGASTVGLLFSTSPLGTEPTFTSCGSAAPITLPAKAPGVPETYKKFRGTCALPKGTAPSSVTAVGVLEDKAAPANGTGGPTPQQKVSDAARVQPFAESPSQMKLTLAPVEPASRSAAFPTGRRIAAAGSACATFRAHVVDRFGHPVVGVNVDARLEGPTDLVQFGSDGNTKAPDNAAVQEVGSGCSSASSTGGSEGKEVVPNGGDRKLAESLTGTNGDGNWDFKLYSIDPGITNITAWIDDLDAPSETDDRPADNDLQDPTDVSATSWAQFLDGNLKLSITPKNDASPTSACHVYTITAAAGSTVAAGLNIDLHARMPDGSLHLCYAGGAETLSPPDSGHPEGDAHKPKQFSAECDDKGPACIHVEGVTNENGKLIFGVSSGTAGTGNFFAWVDGEPEANDDVIDTNVPSIANSTNFTSYAQQVSVKLVNPIPSAAGADFGGGKISVSDVPVVVRIDAPFLVPKVQVLVKPKDGTKYVKLGEAERIGMSDTYVYNWNLNVPLPSDTPAPASTESPEPTPSPTKTGKARPTPSASPSPSPTPVQTVVDPPPSPTPPPQPSAPPSSVKGIPDGNYTLRVFVEGTGQSDVTDLTVNRAINPQSNDTTSPFQTATLDESMGYVVGFSEQAAQLKGVASAGAEGVDFYYSTSGAKESPRWSRCGFVYLAGSATAAQPFQGFCVLPADESGKQVTGVAVVPWDCKVPAPQANCSGPTPTPVANTNTNVPARSSSLGEAGSGEAKRIFGCNESPCLSLQPFDWQGDTGQCQRYVVLVGDQAGKPMSGENVDITLSGPGDGAHFCTDVEGATPLRHPEQDGEYYDANQSVIKDPSGPDVLHTEGEANAEGQLIFGVYSNESDYQSIFATTENSFMSINAWVDSDKDDVLDEHEIHDFSSMHWLLPGRCTTVGTEGDDLLVGTVDDDKICGLGGDDTVFAEEGVDIILGGDGNDELWGDEGSDVIQGESGDDTIYGGPGKDKFDGGDGANTCPDWKRKKDKAIKSCDVPAKPPPE